MTIRLLTVFFLLSVFSSPASAQTEALMLGYRMAEAGSSTSGSAATRPNYRTLLVYPEGGEYRGQTGTGILTTSGSDLLRVGVKRSLYNNWTEDFAWMAAPGALPIYTGIDAFNGEYCRGYRSQQIRFTTGRYVGVETLSAGYCDGTASPWNFKTFSVLRADSLQGDGLDLPDVLGGEALEAFYRGAESFLRRLPETRRARYLPDADPANWSLDHRSGRWVLIGRLESAEMATSADVADFEVPFEIPAGFMGAKGQLTRTQVQRAARDARDVFVSPSGNLVAIRRQHLLTVHPVSGGQVGAAVLGHALPEDASVVMVQWVNERTALRVRRTLRGEGGR